MTLTVSESHRLPESMEAALYVCGRLLLDAVATSTAPVALTLAVSPKDVQLAATAPTEVNGGGDKRHEHALRLLGDRLGTLGGAVTTASSAWVTKIECQVSLNIESGEALDGSRWKSEAVTSP